MLPPEITPDDFLKLKSETSNTPAAPFLLDVREPWEHERAAIAGTTLIPMGEIPTRAHAELDPDQPIIVMCHHGARSLSVTLWLRNQGFDHAQSLIGGIDEWSRRIDPTIPRY